MPDITLWGFDNSTFVRTVKMLFAEKGETGFKQVPLNVLKGEPRSAEHRQRHPFGKVPVLEYDGTLVLETAAIARFLNDKLPGPALVPATAEDRARMDMVIGVIDSYGYNALLGGVVAYHLFPDFVGGKNEAARQKGLETGRTVIEFVVKTRGSADHRLRGDDAGQGRAARRRRLRRLVGAGAGAAELQGDAAARPLKHDRLIMPSLRLEGAALPGGWTRQAVQPDLVTR